MCAVRLALRWTAYFGMESGLNSCSPLKQRSLYSSLGSGLIALGDACRIRKLKKDIDEEQRRCKALTSQIAAESKPRFTRTSSNAPGSVKGRNSAGGSMNGNRNSSSGNKPTAAAMFTRANSGFNGRSSSGAPQAVAEGRATPRDMSPAPYVSSPASVRTCCALVRRS